MKGHNRGEWGMGNEMEEEEQLRNICEVAEMLVQWWYLDRL